MPKRKTRQEKIKSDYRRQLSFGQEATFAYQIAPKNQEQPQVKISSVAPKTILYPFLKADLRKTMVLTLCIVVVQFVLYFLLKNHVFTLPGLTY